MVIRALATLLVITFYSSGLLAEDSSEFSVKTISTKIPVPPKPIQLISPQHKSKVTPGILTFIWEQTTFVPSAKVQLTVEKLDENKKYVMRTKHSQKQMHCNPGNYRWRVTGVDNPTHESRWRSFNVIGYKSRGMASIPNEKIGLKKKTKPLPSPQ